MKVKIYTTTTCPYCHTAMEFFKENKVEYQEINVQKDSNAAKEMVEKSGQMGVPVIMIGDEIIIGFDKEKIKATLKL